jgi:tRNA-binding protein
VRELRPTIGVDQFFAADLRVGRIVEAVIHTKARKPAYVLTIDFGPELGMKQSSAQLTADYGADGLLGKQVVAVVNFAPRNVAGVKSEVLVLAAVEATGRTIILQPDQLVQPGTPVA